MIDFLDHLNNEVSVKRFYLENMTRTMLYKTLYEHREKRQICMLFDELIKIITQKANPYSYRLDNDLELSTNHCESPKLEIHMHGAILEVVYAFLKFYEKYKLGLENNAYSPSFFDDIDDFLFESSSSYYDKCFDIVKKELSTSPYISQNELEILKEKIEYYSKLVPYEKAEQEIAEQERLESLRDEETTREILDHLAYEEGELRYSPYVEPEEYDRYYGNHNNDSCIDYNNSRNAYDKYDWFAPTEAQQIYGFQECFINGRYAYEIEEFLSLQEIKDLPLDKKMEHYEIDDIEEFCEKYPMLISAEEASELDIKPETYCKLVFYNYVDIAGAKSPRLRPKTYNEEDSAKFVPSDPEEIPF